MKACLLCVLLCVMVRADEEYMPHHRTKRASSNNLNGEIITVTTIEAPPYVRRVKGYTGPIRKREDIEGFIPDLLDRLSHMLNFQYKIKQVADGRYGTRQNDTGKWNGMVGEVVSGKAMMAAAPITMTADRERDVDFVQAFQHVGITFVMQKSVLYGKNKIWYFLFNIFMPLAPEVWALVTVLTILVALVLWGMNRFNPYEWGGRYNLGHATADEADVFSITGSLWFTFTTLQWQGYDRSPRSLGSRVLACFWFVFVTLTLVTYTGSLVNHLFWASTVHGKDPFKPPVSSFEELVENGKIDYGPVKGGSTYYVLSLFATGEMYEQMRRYWKNHETSLVSNTTEGLRRVRQGNYAFIMESMTAKYYVNQRPCDLAVVNEVLHPRMYGFAVSHKYQHLEKLNLALLELRESGEIDAMEKYWWEGRGECWNVTKAEKAVAKTAFLEANEPARVTMQNFWGALLLLLLGIVISIIVAVVEIIFFKYRGRYSAANRPGGAQLKLDEDDGRM